MSSKAAYAKAKELMAQNPEMFKSQEPHSLARKITDSSLYDWNSTARFLLTQLAVLAMDDDSSYPEDAPDEFKADKEGWCWMSQEKLALKVGRSESQVQRLATQFENDGVILKREWRDSNMTRHTEYKVLEQVVDAYQRPKNGSRPPRYSKKRTANAGSFSTDNQPKKNAQKRAVMEEDDE